MPSVSKKQQRLMGMAYGYAQGEMSKASDSVKKLSRSFIKGKRKGTKDYKKNIKKLKDFASTKHDSLPEKITEKHILRFSEFFEHETSWFYLIISLITSDTIFLSAGKEENSFIIKPTVVRPEFTSSVTFWVTSSTDICFGRYDWIIVNS